MPDEPLIRVIDSRPASEAAHAGLLALGFEGSVLKRPTSTYRPGRQSAWRKLKARHVATATLRDVRQARDGQSFAVCDRDGARILAAAGTAAAELIGEQVEIGYSRIDADGTLREARLLYPVAT